MLHQLRERYRNDCIYTYIGEILLAINPCRLLPIYSSATLHSYQSAVKRIQSTPDGHSHSANPLTELQALPPHVFAVAATAYYYLCSNRQVRSYSLSLSLSLSLFLSLSLIPLLYIPLLSATLLYVVYVIS